MLKNGIIIKNISNSYVVNASGENYTCVPRGIFRFEKVVPLVGDKVDIETDSNTITKIYPRVNFFERPPIANVNYAIIMTSVKSPDLSLNLLDRLIFLCEVKKVKPIICFSKLDLLDKHELINVKKIIKYYRKIGYIVLTNRNLIFLKLLLHNKIAFLMGQTGAGKSTLLNKLNKNLKLETNPISEALGRGVHTTRHIEIYKIANFYIADTPGFSSIDLKNVKSEEVKNYFREFQNLKCKYDDCNHDKEDCEVKKAVNNSLILKSRYDNYLRFYKEVYENSSKLYK